MMSSQVDLARTREVVCTRPSLKFAECGLDVLRRALSLQRIQVERREEEPGGKLATDLCTGRHVELTFHQQTSQFPTLQA